MVHNIFYSAPSRLIGQRHASTSTTIGSRHGSAPPMSSAIRACAATATASACTVSTIATSSTRSAASRRRWPRSVYRDGLFPRSEYAAAWAALSETLPRRDACRRMVDLLWLAHDEACEAELAALIDEDLAAGRLPDARDLKMRLEPRRRSLPADVPVALTELASFDALLEMCA